MDLCTIAFCLANLYVTGEVLPNPGSGPQSNEGYWCGHRPCQGPIGRLRLGMVAQLTDNFVIDYGVEHQSFILEKDRGYETVFLSITWRPFR